MKKVIILSKDLLITVILAFILTYLLQSLIMETRYVPTTSMVPTIKVNQRVLVNKLAYKYQNPKRGDIIVFTPPVENEDKDYVKRIIGIAGDKIEVKDGYVYINDQKMKENYIFEKPNYDFGPTLIPENCLYVLGDNRNESYDSHLWGKWLDENQIKGKVVFTYWPLEEFGVIE
ncbi:signal peptidase I Serine peptidase. MEROPS family S26A [Desulfonispora thiosulfatigenes DSM 11270]|uniref:Signal peptidase I n=1 Tax=Desulfonispora thiosulfatigenes DSM 11270 TaxID=656914 RepID=A0A1W1VMP5_DESTI|nr:signal peptidase I [Desulfonispora thiosulfatigenes]SMB94632.1 signal peptidase I Serine peptidase. MEROPS family S26A [Desulfonispora thiosulfatigenes DSM 11270]